MTLATIAATFAASLITDTRTNGDKFVRLADGSPAWMGSIVQTAHGDMFPDDTKYKMIRELAHAIDSRLSDDPDSDLEDVRHELIDNAIPVYNMDRLRWLSSHLDRASYCDEARAEGLVADDADMFDRIAAGIDHELSMIWQAIVDGLAEQVEEEEETDDEEGGEEPA